MNQETQKITANGEIFTIAKNTTLPQFLESIQLSADRVVVERNGNALTPGETKATTLEDEDTLEIVRIVAGG